MKPYVPIITPTLLLFIAIYIITSGCEKKEFPVPPHKEGEIDTVVIPIGYPYNNQVFYNCNTNKITGINLKYNWDLAFDCAPNSNTIRLNVAKGMLAAEIFTSNFDSTFSTNNLTWKWDKSDGNKDSTAIGNWQKKQHVYILNRQYNEAGTFLGYKKIFFISLENDIYTFKYADLNGSNEKTFSIKKDPDYNHLYFSFEDGGKIVSVEPPKDQWDILFTNYQHKFPELSLPFLVTGALINTFNHVVAAEDSIQNFYSIQLKDTSLYHYSSDYDIIGYDWKIRNKTDNSFTIDPKKYYILKSSTGIFYKIKFIDFYNSQGQKGYPTFQIQKL